MFSVVMVSMFFVPFLNWTFAYAADSDLSGGLQVCKGPVAMSGRGKNEMGRTGMPCSVPAYRGRDRLLSRQLQTARKRLECVRFSGARGQWTAASGQGTPAFPKQKRRSIARTPNAGAQVGRPPAELRYRRVPVTAHAANAQRRSLSARCLGNIDSARQRC